MGLFAVEIVSALASFINSVIASHHLMREKSALAEDFILLPRRLK